ncbi:unnamed protein product [Arctogadus glacialis]
MAFSPTPQHGDVRDGQFPMIEVLNPQDGSPAYVFRAWRPSDIKDIAEWLPDPSAVGGAAFATYLLELVQQHKASISEVRQLCTYRLTLRWGRIQGDMPGRDEADLMFSWDQGSVYRRLVEGLCDRARGVFPMVRDWTALRKVQQQPGETLTDLVDRVEKVFKIHGGMPVPTDRVVQTPYEESLTAALLDALAKNISEFIQTHCIGWRTARLDLIISHATHAEDLFMNKEMLGQKKDKEVTQKLHLAQLKDLKDRRPTRRYKDQRTDQPEERTSRGLINRDCLYCGSKDHWLKDCPIKNEENDEADDWEFAPSREVTVNHPRGRDPVLDNAPPPPAFSPTSGPIQCKYPTSRLLYIRLWEAHLKATERSAGRHKETVQQDQQHQSGNLHGACVATRKWPEQRDKGGSQRRERCGDRHFKGQPVMRMRGRKQRERWRRVQADGENTVYG